MTSQDLRHALPRHKHDLERAREIVRLGYPAVEPVLDELMVWMQDMNWPVSEILAPFLASIGEPLIPYIKRVLAADDDTWKYWVLLEIVANSPAMATALGSPITEIASKRPTNEEEAALNEAACFVLLETDNGNQRR